VTISLDTDKHEYFEHEFNKLDLLDKEIINKEFDNCIFIGCNFSDAFFNDCRFYDCEFKSCNVSNMKLKGSSFSNSIMEDTKAIGINWAEITLPSVKVYNPIDFYRCNIDHSIFIGLDLKEISIHECQSKNVDFREANLTKSDLTHTDFLNSHFNNTDLTEADFSFSINYNINIFNNIIKQARFSLPEAMSLLTASGINIQD